MQKLVNEIFNEIKEWTIFALGSIFFIILLPILLIKPIFSKKSSNLEKITTTKWVLLTIVCIGGICIYSNYQIDIDNLLESAIPVVIVIMIIGVAIFAIIDKFIQNIKFSKKNKEKKYDTYEFINEEGNKQIYTIGYNDAEKFDIYWADVIASKNNKKEIITADGVSLMMSGFDPSEATNFLNKTCSSCDGNVDRFYFIDNFSKMDDEYGDDGWMEVCFKCRKILFLETGSRD